MRTLYESYNPENTHAMREYMLYVINRHIKRMHKHNLISETVFKRFDTLDSLQEPLVQSPALNKYLS